MRSCEYGMATISRLMAYVWPVRLDLAMYVLWQPIS
jgi:hypothetical protein